MCVCVCVVCVLYVVWWVCEGLVAEGVGRVVSAFQDGLIISSIESLTVGRFIREAVVARGGANVLSNFLFV